jgi:hypothetical protein
MELTGSTICCGIVSVCCLCSCVRTIAIPRWHIRDDEGGLEEGSGCHSDDVRNSASAWGLRSDRRERPPSCEQELVVSHTSHWPCRLAR